MRIFHKVQAVENRRLYIPYAMRAALGWHRKQSLYCWRYAKDTETEHNQITLSAVEPKPDAIWTLSARFLDRRGLLTDLSTLMRDEGVNIITCRGSSSMQNREFGVEMEIDTLHYTRQSDTSLRELHALIVCAFIKDIVFEADDTPRLEIVANRELAESRHIGPIERTEVDNRHVLIPSAFLESTTESFRRQHHLPPKAQPLLAAVVADIKSAIVDATFFYPHTGYRHVLIRSKDKIGTLRKITDTLHKHRFNVLQAYHRTIQFRVSSQTDLLLYRKVDVEKVETDHDLVTEIQAIFRDTPGMEDFECTVVAPKLCTRLMEDQWEFRFPFKQQ